MKTENILGINITNASRGHIEKMLSDCLRDGKDQIKIATPNPEMILAAQKDEEYFYILNNAELSLLDGIGLKFAGFAIGKNIPRFTGVELTEFLLSEASRSGQKVLILNWKKGLSTREEIVKAVKKDHPSIDVMVLNSDREGKDIDHSGLEQYGPRILLCAFGVPWQEKYIYNNLKNLSSVRLAAGIGGTFDYYTGKIGSTPKIFKAFGLEWLWRLLQIPAFSDRKKRLKRIFNAVLVFPYKFIVWRFLEPFCYRKNVACLLYKKEDNRYFVFLVERRDEKGHWQMPQGGLSGQSILEAGKKELREETGNSNFEVVHYTKFIYKYRFPKLSKTNFRGADMPKHAGFKGQKQALLIARFKGEDKNIAVNYWDHRAWKWVAIEEFLNTVHKTRKHSNAKYLDIFNNIIK